MKNNYRFLLTSLWVNLPRIVSVVFYIVLQIQTYILLIYLICIFNKYFSHWLNYWILFDIFQLNFHLRLLWLHFPMNWLATTILYMEASIIHDYKIQQMWKKHYVFKCSFVLYHGQHLLTLKAHHKQWLYIKKGFFQVKNWRPVPYFYPPSIPGFLFPPGRLRIPLLLCQPDKVYSIKTSFASSHWIL